MHFFKKISVFAFVGLIVFVLGTHFFSPDQTSDAPITIYQSITPAVELHPLQTSEPTAQSLPPHDRSQDPSSIPHSPDPAVGSSASQDNYDWRDDSTFRSQSLHKDPWQETSAQNLDVEPVHSEDAEIYPPRDWYKTEDPVLRAEYYRAQLN